MCSTVCTLSNLTNDNLPGLGKTTAISKPWRPEPNNTDSKEKKARETVYAMTSVHRKNSDVIMTMKLVM